MTESQKDRAGKLHPMPFTRLEIAVMALIDGRLHVLLARRAEPPHAGRWALPGGALRIDLDRTLDDGARRVMHERLGLDLPFLRQLCAVGGATRDPRAPWALSVVYRALVQSADPPATAGKRVTGLEWRPVDDAAADKSLAFDHAALVARAAGELRDDVARLEFPAGLLPDTFTLGELQAASEQILGRKLDKSSFRRRLADADVVAPVAGALKGGANRPAQMYRMISV